MARKSKKHSTCVRPEQSSRSRISYAIATILGSASAAHYGSVMAADTGANANQIEEVIVTAQRRTENVQDVPIAIQALTADTLTQLNVSTLDDFVRYLPNVTAPSSGPAMSQVFMRGLSVGSDGDDWCLRAAGSDFQITYTLRCFITIHFRHLTIHQDQVEAVRFEKIESLGAA